MQLVVRWRLQHIKFVSVVLTNIHSYDMYEISHSIARHTGLLSNSPLWAERPLKPMNYNVLVPAVESRVADYVQ